MTKNKLVAAVLAAAFLAPLSATHAFDLATDTRPAAKTDNGLGELPNASEWREPFLYMQPAEKRAADTGTDSDDAALHPMPAARADTGLGALPGFSEWKEPFLYIQPAPKVDNGLGEYARKDTPRS